MNLPPDKLKLLSQYDNEKKWELVCDQVRLFDYYFWLVSHLNITVHVIKQSRVHKVHKHPKWLCGEEQIAV